MMEPVAWRYRYKQWAETYWHYFTKEPRNKEADEIWEPLVRLSDAEARIEAERLRFEGDLDKWMKTIGAGISGYQPEAYAVMDAACDELVRLRSRAEAAEALLKEVVTAWEVLPAWHQTARVVERWLANDMKPVIDKLRAALKGDEQ